MPSIPELELQQRVDVQEKRIDLVASELREIKQILERMSEDLAVIANTLTH